MSSEIILRPPDTIQARVLREIRETGMLVYDYEAVPLEPPQRWSVPSLNDLEENRDLKTVRQILSAGRTAGQRETNLSMHTERYRIALAQDAPGSWLLQSESNEGKVPYILSLYITPTIAGSRALTHGLFAMQYAHFLYEIHGWKLIIHRNHYFAFWPPADVVVGIVGGKIHVTGELALSGPQVLRLATLDVPYPPEWVNWAHSRMLEALCLYDSARSSFAQKIVRLWAITQSYLGVPSQLHQDTYDLDLLFQGWLEADKMPSKASTSRNRLRLSAIDEALASIEEGPEDWKIAVLARILIPLVMTKSKFHEFMFSRLEARARKADPGSWARGKRYLIYLKEKLT